MPALMKSSYLDKTAELILKELKGIIPENEYTEISAKKNENEKFTQTIFRTYEGEKISRVAMEQYTINNKAYGLVLNIYPDPAYGIPIFTFQLGGQIPDKVIFVLDIIPVLPSNDDQKLTAIYQRHASTMDHLGSSQEWLSQICSNNALICQYKPLEPEKILIALTDYLSHWRDVYYLPARPNLNEQEQKTAAETILKFKTILHANDAGLEIYLRKFGKEMSAAIEYAAFGSAAVFSGDNQNESDIQDVPDPGANQDAQVKWMEDAEQYVQDAPRFVRSTIRNNAEKKAIQLGIKEITRSFIEDLRK